jgi:ABC-2 type transport system permease protein
MRGPLAWSIRREVWENRSIYLAPAAVAAFTLLALMVHSIGLPSRMRALASVEHTKRHMEIVMPFSLSPLTIMLASFIVAFFYSLDALYGERRDRSLLFWKSMPVSDAHTVVAKFSIPMLVLPVISLVLGLAVFYFQLLFSTIVLMVNGVSPAMLWHEVRWGQEPIFVLYGLITHTLWYAPIYALALFISASVRRTPILWMVLPPIALVAFERMLLGTKAVGSFISYRLGGAMTEGFAAGHDPMHDRMSDLEVVRIFTSPGLWGGLIVAAALVAAAVRQRRKN